MKKSLLIAAGVALSAMPVVAQKLGDGYVVWPSSENLPTYVSQWNGGNGKITIKDQTWEDENFFISRVKPKERFYNTETQVYTNITQWSADNPNGNDKRLCYWVPIGEEERSGVKLNAMPDGVFDGEVFSMWSYIDNYGDWNSPYGFTPGVFADVCHKNGVGTHGVAGVPFGNLGGWYNTFTSLVNLGADKVGKFLYYFGQDGLGYNSEWGSPGAKTIGLTTLHDGLATYMASRNPVWEVMWYAGVGDNGGNYFDTGIGLFTGLFKGSSIFLNYNWNNSISTITSSVNTAQGMGRSPFYIYAGMNMQGGEPKYNSNYDLLKDYQHSIGLWGAHKVNMFWQDRFGRGSSPLTKASYYQTEIETWFGNGPRNPAIKKDITLNRAHRPNADWAGMSSMMSARSSINWSLEDETFYSYFNLGNGLFFNWMGDRMHNNEWYNIGIQDYLPTWRFWFAPTWKGGQGAGKEGALSASDVNLNASFVWDDAYVGGSCLKVSGTTQDEYLHLFKTNLTWNSMGKTIVRFTYKLIGGKGDISLVFDGTNSNGSKDKYQEYKFQTVASSEDVEDKSYLEGKEGWTTVEYQIPNSLQMRWLHMIGLRFENAENLEMLIGGLVIDRKTFTTPSAPEITTAKVLAYNNAGVDGKLIWNMPNTKVTGEPCYNSDVNASMYRLWAQQEGEEMQNYGATTSWAGIVFAAKANSESPRRMRFGVSAVSADMKSESEITWSEYLDLPEYAVSEDIAIDKSIIKPNEKFGLSFVDPLHSSGTWTLTDAEGNQVWSAEGVSVECPGLPNIGAYTLTLKKADGTVQEFPRYVAISSEAVGALPEIYTLSIDDQAVAGEDVVEVKLNEAKKFSYTGRPADGSSSRGIDLNENWFGVRCGEIGLQSNTSFSVAAWVKYNELPTGRSTFITVEDRTGGCWPYNNWGYFWSRINDQGRFIYDGVDNAWGWRTDMINSEGGRLFYRYEDSKVDVGAWTHVAIVFEYKEGTNQMRSQFYLNGKLQKISEWVACNKGLFEGAVQSGKYGTWSELVKVAQHVSGAKYGTDTYQSDYVNHSYGVSNEMWITFGGSSQDISAVKGCVDDFQVWAKAMTQEDVEKSMAGLDRNNLPAEVLGFWDLETDCESDYGFIGAAGSNATNNTPKAYWYSIASEGENANERNFGAPIYLVGSPFISGTAYPVVTKPTWTTRRATVAGDGTGESGSADIAWSKEGDYTVQLKLANGHGEATMDYPVVKIGESSQGIDDIDVDGDGFKTYTIEDALFVEFDGDGRYTIEVFNMAGMTVGGKTVDAVAGQNASVRLGAAGVYLVKVSRDGQLLRTVKVIRK